VNILHFFHENCARERGKIPILSDCGHKKEAETAFSRTH
jgi:hypothetical protein